MDGKLKRLMSIATIKELHTHLMQSKEPSDLTKILVNKIHGGKENAREFWEEEQQDQEKSCNVKIPKPDKKRSNNKYLIPYSSIAAAITIIFIVVLLKPELFPFLDRKWVHDKTVKKYVELADTKEQQKANTSSLANRPVSRPQPTVQPKPDYNPTPKTFSLQNGLKIFSTKGRTFAWKDSQGIRHFSNTQYPADNPTLQVETKPGTFNKVTRINIIKNQIYVPVTLSSSSETFVTYLQLDTNTKRTIIPYRHLDKLNVTYGKIVGYTSFNNVKTEKRETSLDLFRVGPKNEKDFTVLGAEHAGSRDTGIMGKDFIDHNPFRIDPNGQFIIWM